MEAGTELKNEERSKEGEKEALAGREYSSD